MGMQIDRLAQAVDYSNGSLALASRGMQFHDYFFDFCSEPDICARHADVEHSTDL
jgi:hypothetical protein